MDTCYVARGQKPNLCAVHGLHVLGCPGHPDHREYCPSSGYEARAHGRIEGAKTLYARDVIGTGELERRIELALRGEPLVGDPTRP